MEENRKYASDMPDDTVDDNGIDLTDFEFDEAESIFEDHESIDEIGDDFSSSDATLENYQEEEQLTSFPFDDGSDSFMDGEDLEPVSLSNDELDNILSDSDFEDTVESEKSEPENFSEMGLPDSEMDDFGKSDIVSDDDFSTELELPQDFFEATDENFAEPGETPDDTSFFEDEDDSITLDDQELGSILDDVKDDTDYSAGEIIEESPLSDEELSDVLFESGLDGAKSSFPEAEVDETPVPSVIEFGADEDESITLTQEELGNIVSDVSEGAVVFSDGEGDSILNMEDDEGPLALSEGELDAILEDVVEVPLAEFPASAPSPVPVAVGAKEASATVSPTGGELKKEEMRKMISYLDELFGDLPDEAVQKFSNSEYFDLYKKIMNELGL